MAKEFLIEIVGINRDGERDTRDFGMGPNGVMMAAVVAVGEVEEGDIIEPKLEELAREMMGRVVSYRIKEIKPGDSLPYYDEHKLEELSEGY